MTDALTIEIANEATTEICDALNALIPQLSSSTTSIAPSFISRVIDSDACDLLLARDGDGRIIGTLTLVTFAIPTGIRAWIEDVVVDTNARGLGAGKALVAAANERARALGAHTVDLTSRPSREAANALYVAMGFETRETNVYRYEIN